MRLDTLFRKKRRQRYHDLRGANLHADTAWSVSKDYARLKGIFESWPEERELPFGFRIKIDVIRDDDNNRPESLDGASSRFIQPLQNHKGWPLGQWHIYDWRAAMEEALRDRWDSAPYSTGTPVERARRAVQKEYEHLQEWFDDGWEYVGIVVELCQNGKLVSEDSIWGIESCCPIHAAWTGRQMAARLLRAAHREFFRERGDAWRQYELF
jgi:hypothetical protein